MNKQTFVSVTTLLCRTLLYSFLVISLCGACTKDDDNADEGGGSGVPSVTLISCTKDTKFTSSIVYKVVIKITDEGGSKVSKKGVKFGTTSECSYTSTSITNSDNAPQYTVAITPLKPNLKYYVKAFATNNDGTSYSNVTSFTAK